MIPRARDVCKVVGSRWRFEQEWPADYTINWMVEFCEFSSYTYIFPLCLLKIEIHWMEVHNMIGSCYLVIMRVGECQLTPTGGCIYSFIVNAIPRRLNVYFCAFCNLQGRLVDL